MNMRRTRLITTWLLWAALVTGAVAWLVVRQSPEPRTLSERVTAIAQTLRCPVCRDLSVAESPSEIARQMRSSIAARLRAGQSAEQVRAAFVRAYGQWILLSPPARGLGLLVWLAPFAALALGGLFIVRTVRGLGRPRPDAVADAVATDTALSSEERRMLERALAGSLPDEDA